MKQIRLATAFFVACVSFVSLVLFVNRASSQERWEEGPPLSEVWTVDLTAAAAATVPGVPTEVATLVTTTHTYSYTPPSPDPTGLTYYISGTTHSLLISDSEVNEQPGLFTGDNLFETGLDGALLRTSSTFTPTVYSDEPTGVAQNSTNGHLFFSDDVGNPRVVHEVDPGPDGILNTGDDGAPIEFDLETIYGGIDLEGIAVDSAQGRVFVADAQSEDVFVIDMGADGTLGGSDNSVSNFDVSALGIVNPFGVEFNPDNGHLYILAGPGALIAETLTDGTLLRYIDISDASPYNPSGLAFAPDNGHLYVLDRGLDNVNDGQMYELAFALNAPPAVDAGADQTITLPDPAILDGTVIDDDGGPTSPPGTTWSQQSGPGIVTFDDATAVDTTATFSTDGTYVLRLTADDGEADPAYDEVTITVNPQSETNTPPTVDAGPNQTITLPDPAMLDGTVNDDGLPDPPGDVATTWSKVSGPGTVTFGNSKALDTTATFSTDGVYVLRLTADDGELSADDEITITVDPFSIYLPLISR